MGNQWEDLLINYKDNVKELLENKETIIHILNSLTRPYEKPDEEDEEEEPEPDKTMDAERIKIILESIKMLLANIN